jgi:hypothetical protein
MVIQLIIVVPPTKTYALQIDTNLKCINIFQIHITHNHCPPYSAITAGRHITHDNRYASKLIYFTYFHSRHQKKKCFEGVIYEIQYPPC